MKFTLSNLHLITLSPRISENNSISHHLRETSKRVFNKFDKSESGTINYRQFSPLLLRLIEDDFIVQMVAGSLLKVELDNLRIGSPVVYTTDTRQTTVDVLQAIDLIKDEVFHVVVPAEGTPFVQWEPTQNALVGAIHQRVEKSLLLYVDDLQKSYFASVFGFDIASFDKTEEGTSSTATALSRKITLEQFQDFALRCCVTDVKAVHVFELLAQQREVDYKAQLGIFDETL